MVMGGWPTAKDSVQSCFVPLTIAFSDPQQLDNLVGTGNQNLETISDLFGGIKLGVKNGTVVVDNASLTHFTSDDKGFQLRLSSLLSVLQSMASDGVSVGHDQIDQAYIRATDVQNDTMRGLAERTRSGHPVIFQDLYPKQLENHEVFAPRITLRSCPQDPDYASSETLEMTEDGRRYRAFFIGENKSILTRIQERTGEVLITANNDRLVFVGRPEKTALARDFLLSFVQTALEAGAKRQAALDAALSVAFGDMQVEELRQVITQKRGKGKTMKTNQAATFGEQEIDMTNLHINEMIPTTNNQAYYYDALMNPAHGAVITQGPAGTGKTSLFLQAAMLMLRRHYRGEAGYNHDKLILSFPLVSVGGGKLGALPGDKMKKTYDKFATYYDHLERILAPVEANGVVNIARGKKTLENLIQRGIIEIQLLEDLRGKSYPNALMALDEAQNTTSKQMLTYITRPETTSRLFVMGDLEQADRMANKDEVEHFEMPSFVRIDVDGHVWLSKNGKDLRLGFHEDVGRFVASNQKGRARTIDLFTPANGLAELFLAYSHSPYAACCILEPTDCQRSGFARDVMDLRLALRAPNPSNKKAVPVGKGTADPQKILHEAATRKEAALTGSPVAVVNSNVIAFNPR